MKLLQAQSFIMTDQYKVSIVAIANQGKSQVITQQENCLVLTLAFAQKRR